MLAQARAPGDGLLEAQAELQFRLLPAVEARHTSESAAMFRSHKLERSSLEQKQADERCQPDALHVSERAAVVKDWCSRYGPECHEQRDELESTVLESRQLRKSLVTLQQKSVLQQDFIAAVAQQVAVMAARCQGLLQFSPCGGIQD